MYFPLLGQLKPILKISRKASNVFQSTKTCSHREHEIHAICKLNTVKSLMLTVIKKIICNVNNHIAELS